jgi:glycosyltransferase involved in cell wall biosynthesis
MRILIPYDVNTTGAKNPFLFLLMRDLIKLPEIEHIQHGYGWLYEDMKADIVHLHWPELLVKSRLSDMSQDHKLTEHDFMAVISSLEKLKKAGAKICITVHNETPHKNASAYGDFYRDIYRLCDGIIHMGSASESILEREFPGISDGKPTAVIPHGDYSYFPSDKSREYCRQWLGVAEEEKLVLSFGAIRSKKELEMAVSAFKKADVSNGRYLMAGRLPSPYKSQLSHFTDRKILYANMFQPSIQTYEEPIGKNDVQLFLKAADLLFIPRFNTLNSGNVPLGFTFGKVVAGPDYGVIGEMLNTTGNPVFDPSDIRSIAQAIRKGLDLSAANHGEKNLEYAEKHLKWEMIAEKTSALYQELLNG